MQVLIKRSLHRLPAGSRLYQTKDGWYAWLGQLLSPTTLRSLVADWYATADTVDIPNERWYVGPSGQVTVFKKPGYDCFLFKMDALVESERKKNPNTRYQSVRKRKKQPVTLLGTCPE